ncbi:Unknown protein [Striga hermonthica]|uniref:R13L1/DRL21-like LRR repeat region domain-containing protein n=1 Tax=Striga hermonthica TaxID=68872 RepID=A0A9N7NEH9_STRHE|nr:Unknown protein [Striga hermonthica]
MHDLIHDMARLVAKDVCFHVEHSPSNYFPLFGNSCHLSVLHAGSGPLELKASKKNERLRTFLVMVSRSSNEAPPTAGLDPQLFLNLQFFRALGLSRAGLTELPGNIDNLVYLRYEESFQIAALRHGHKGQLRSMAAGLGSLTSLQTLSSYIIRLKKGQGIEELKNINCLKGSLSIENINYVSNARDAEEASLGTKARLDKLELRWRKTLTGDPSLQAQVFANLQPHENLKEMLVQNYCGEIYPSWLTETTRRFTSIHLHGLRCCDTLPALGQLPFLKSFYLSDMPRLEYVNYTFYGAGNGVKFPSLESFELRNIVNLKQWTNISSGAMPRLVSFTIRKFENLECLPPEIRAHLPSSEVSDCPKL